MADNGITIIKVSDLEGMLTDQVERLVHEGYVITIADMRSWETHEVAHVDLYRNGTIVRVVLIEGRTEVDGRDVSTIELGLLTFDLGHRPTKYDTLWDYKADRHDTVGKWYRIADRHGDGQDVYTNVKGMVRYVRIRDERMCALQPKRADGCIHGRDSMRRVAEIVRRRRGYARTRISDIKSVTHETRGGRSVYVVRLSHTPTKSAERHVVFELGGRR